MVLRNLVVSIIAWSVNLLSTDIRPDCKLHGIAIL